MPYLIQASLSLLIFYTAYRIFFDKSKLHAYKRAYLLFGLIASVLLPIIQIDIHPIYVVAAVPSQVVPHNVVQQTVWTWEDILLIAYVIGALIVAFKLLYQLYKIYRITQEGKRINTDGVIKVFTKEPITTSSFLHFIFIPLSEKTDISSFELIHEKSHINHHHSYDLLLLSMYQVFFWFNPLIYWYRKSVTEVHEYQADEEVIKTLSQEAYESYLIQQHSIKYTQQLTNNFYSLIKKRLIMMNSNNTAKKSKFLLIIPATLICMSLFSFRPYPVYPISQMQTGVQSDSVPVSYYRTVTDTIITFDAINYEETVEIVTRQQKMISIYDTVTVFDPATGKETVDIIRFDVPADEKVDRSKMILSDTIITFNPENYTEEIKIIKREKK